MTDRELLELAAKAVGVNGTMVELTLEPSGQRLEGIRDPKIATPWNLWNPLTDDGDALRLAVKLGITVRNGHGFACAYADTPNFMTQPPCEQYNENGGCRLAATRRAIVRAAAEIGRAMP